MRKREEIQSEVLKLGELFDELIKQRDAGECVDPGDALRAQHALQWALDDLDESPSADLRLEQGLEES